MVETISALRDTQVDSTRGGHPSEVEKDCSASRRRRPSIASTRGFASHRSASSTPTASRSACSTSTRRAAWPATGASTWSRSPPTPGRRCARSWTTARFIFERDKKAKEASRTPAHGSTPKRSSSAPTSATTTSTPSCGMPRGFCAPGYHVKLTIMFRMRELRRPENGYELLSRATERARRRGQGRERPPGRLPGRDLSMVFKPSS